MSGPIKKGSIVKLRSGWTPMVVLKVSDSRVLCRYCAAQRDYEPDETAHFLSRLVLVTDPKTEFAKCGDWKQRLTPGEHETLKSQMAGADQAEPQGEEPMPKLYQTNETTPRFGTLLATNSFGKLVIEMKGTGDVLTFDKSEVEEVMPYTVKVKNLNTGHSEHYLSRIGDLKMGDLIVPSHESSLFEVTGLDTKQATTKKTIRGRKVQTQEFGDADLTE